MLFSKSFSSSFCLSVWMSLILLRGRQFVHLSVTIICQCLALMDITSLFCSAKDYIAWKLQMKIKKKKKFHEICLHLPIIMFDEVEKHVKCQLRGSSAFRRKNREKINFKDIEKINIFELLQYLCSLYSLHAILLILVT